MWDRACISSSPEWFALILEGWRSPGRGLWRAMSEEPSWSGRSGRRETRWHKKMSDHSQLSFRPSSDQALEHISQTRLFQTIHIILIQDQMWPDYSTFSRKYWKFIGLQLKVFQWNFRIAYPWTCVVMVLIVILTKPQLAAQQHDGCGPDVGQRQRSSSWFSVPHSSRLWGSGWFFVISSFLLHFVGIFPGQVCMWDFWV